MILKQLFREVFRQLKNHNEENWTKPLAGLTFRLKGRCYFLGLVSMPDADTHSPEKDKPSDYIHDSELTWGILLQGVRDNYDPALSMSFEEQQRCVSHYLKDAQTEQTS